MKLETNVIKPEVSFFEKEVNHIILSNEWESKLDSKMSEIENYIKNNNGKGKPEEEKDELYKNAQELWKEYAVCLRDTKYNFHLDKNQFTFLTDLILKNLEYDVNTVFFAIELTDLLSSMKDIRYPDINKLEAIPVNATEITYIYHLISPHKVKGLSKNAYYFAQVLRRIGNISKIFNYYDTAGKNLSTEIQNWATAFEDGVSIENRENTIEATVVNAKTETIDINS